MVCFFCWQLVRLHFVLQDQPGIKNIRTVVYEPLLKDTTWVTGKVVDYITFVKYDSKGRAMVENRLKPDGSPHGKLVYVYNPAGQVSREIYATADKGVSDCWGYTYDEKGRLNCIAYMNGQEDTLQITSALYDEAGKMLKMYFKDYVNKRSSGRPSAVQCGWNAGEDYPDGWAG